MCMYISYYHQNWKENKEKKHVELDAEEKKREKNRKFSEDFFYCLDVGAFVDWRCIVWTIKLIYDVSRSSIL